MKANDRPAPLYKVLHVGCGVQRDDKLPADYQTDEWQEIRLDINPDVRPDHVGDIRDMPMIADETMDVVFSSHNLEHLYPHEVAPTLREFHRVLKPGGHVLIACPDLEQVARLILEGKLMEPVFSPPTGPVAPIDMLYGYRTALAKGNHFMAHRTGFTPASLQAFMEEAGFSDVRTTSRPEPLLDIWALGFRVD